jgi:hypothetical protein
VEFCRDPHVAPDRALESTAVTTVKALRGKVARSSEEKFHEIANRRHGVARDLALARHYVTDGGGIEVLRSKVQNRLATMRASKYGK